MKAVVWTKYGPPEGLQLQETEKPVPGDDEVLVRVRAAGVTAGDCEMRRLQLPLMLSFPVRLYAGLLRPKRIKVLGQELAGVVEETGKHVKIYTIGEEVFGTTGFGFGAYAEFICLPAEPGDAQGVLASKPKNMSFEEAVALPTAGFEALHYIRRSNLQPGQKVLVIGAGGSIGTLFIQLAKYYSAEVTGVDSTEKIDLIRSLGADHVIDYTKEDYIKSGEFYDLIIDVVGKASVSRRLKLLKQGGYYFLAFAGLSQVFLSMWVSLTSRKNLKIESAGQKKEDLIFLKELIEAGYLKTIIDKSFSLEQTAEAHRYAESGFKKGNVVIKVNQAEG